MDTDDLTWTSRTMSKLTKMSKMPKVVGSLRSVIIINPNVAKIPYRRVGCAHQIALNLTVEGGHSPPYTKNRVINHG